MTYEERQQARHRLGKRLMIAGVCLMIAGHIWAGYMAQLPTDTIDWWRVVTGSYRGRPELTLAVIIGAVTFTVGTLYRLDEW